MKNVRALAYLVLFISIIAYRNGHLYKNIILKKRELPVGYYYAGDFTKDCTSFQLEGLKNCEDAAFWDVHDSEKTLIDRHLILSCDPGRKAWNTVMGPLHNPEPHGALWLYTANDIPTRITFTNYPKDHDFHPLGFDIWPSYDRNESNLYVTNHARQSTVIEQFVLDPSNPTVARHIRTISSPLFLSPNSIALTSPNSFYVSNDHLMTRRLPIVGHVLPVIESLLSLPLGFVLHVTLPFPVEPNVIIHPSVLFTPFANGVALSPDGATVAIASSSMAQVRFYARNPATNQLTHRTHTIDVPFAADNVRFTDDGTLLVTGHPHFPSLINLAANKSEHSPSWAAAIPPLNTKVEIASDFDGDAPTSMNGLVAGVPGMKTVFQSDGQGFSSASTSLRDDRTGAFYVTGLYADKGFLVCRPPA
ncbi:arylesterase [Amanita muscaria]